MSGTLPTATATRLEKVAVDNGFDQEQPRDGMWLAFGSTQAPLRLWLTALGDSVLVAAFSMAQVDASLGGHGGAIQLPLPAGALGARSVATVADLHHLVRRAFQLSRSLPDELLNTFNRTVAALPRTTEIERLVVERVGQELFRNGLLEYWQGRCAITGLTLPELLRASHIKPWAACETDAERLDVFNGLLLAPNLDAAFDRGFITIADDGEVILSGRLSDANRRALGLTVRLHITALSVNHRNYLTYHRGHVFKQSEAPPEGQRGPAAPFSV
jgi:putative restriction endonuclease